MPFSYRSHQNGAPSRRAKADILHMTGYRPSTVPVREKIGAEGGPEESARATSLWTSFSADRTGCSGRVLCCASRLVALVPARLVWCASRLEALVPARLVWCASRLFALVPARLVWWFASRLVLLLVPARLVCWLLVQAPAGLGSDSPSNGSGSD